MGFIYILQNGLEHVPLDLHKVGHCKDSNGLQNRPRQLRTTGIVGEFEFKAFWEISPEIDIRAVEDAVHLKLRGRRVASDREFFREPLDTLIAEIWSVLQYMSIEASFTQLETPLDTLHRGGGSGEQGQADVLIGVDSYSNEVGPEKLNDQVPQDWDSWESLMEGLEAPVANFNAVSSDFTIRHGLTRSHMAWCRAIYWLSPVLAGEHWAMSFALSKVGSFGLRYIPDPSEAAKLIDFETRLAAQQSAFAELSRIGSGHLFLFDWQPTDHSFSHLASVSPQMWRGDAAGKGIGRVQTEFCWEIGMKEGKGYPHFGVSEPLPLELSEKINDPALKVWTRVIWQLLHCENALADALELPLPESSEALTRMSQVLSLLGDSQYRFSETRINAVTAMWDNRLEVTKSGDRLDADRENRFTDYSRIDLSTLEFLLEVGLNSTGELSLDDLTLLKRGNGGYFLDDEFRAFQKILTRMKPWIK